MEIPVNILRLEHSDIEWNLRENSGVCSLNRDDPLTPNNYIARLPA
jgi:hypothetical protein